MSAVTTIRPVVASEEIKKTDRKTKKDALKKTTKKTAPKAKKSQADKKAEREERERKLDALLIVPQINPSRILVSPERSASLRLRPRSPARPSPRRRGSWPPTSAIPRRSVISRSRG